MSFQETTNKDLWEQKMSQQDQAQFLQSWDWGIFQKSLGRKVWYLDLQNKFVLVIKMPLPLGKSYLYLPRINTELSGQDLKALENLAQEENSIFIKIDAVKQDLSLLGFKKVKSVQPQKTLMLDLAKTEEELLKEMHYKTRYNIRLAAKKGVVVRKGEAQELEIFYNLIANTYSRKGINVYNQEYYKKLLETFNQANLFVAEYQEEIICANLLLHYGDTVTYLHGGSAPEHKNVMAPHLLQWEVIQKAKEKGYKYYDFWGIEEHYPGVARFKKGFGGFEVEYPGTYDFVVNKFWAGLYQLIKKFK